MNKTKPTITQLSPEQEQMRMQVVELELKARFWKAQYDIRHYTLEAEKIQPEYNEYLKVEREKQERMQKDFEEAITKLNETAEQGDVVVAE